MIMINISLLVLGVSLGIWFIGIFWNPFDKTIKINRKKIREYHECKVKRGKTLKQEHQEHVEQKTRDAKARAILISSGYRPEEVANILARQDKANKMKARGYETIK